MLICRLRRLPLLLRRHAELHITRRLMALRDSYRRYATLFYAVLRLLLRGDVVCL